MHKECLQKPKNLCKILINWWCKAYLSKWIDRGYFQHDMGYDDFLDSARISAYDKLLR